MNWHDFPALVFLLTFAISLSPSRRWSHYVLALAVASFCGLMATVLTLIVWGITR